MTYLPTFEQVGLFHYYILFLHTGNRRLVDERDIIRSELVYYYKDTPRRRSGIQLHWCPRQLLEEPATSLRITAGVVVPQIKIKSGLINFQ
jgi:hypothetical protein